MTWLEVAAILFGLLGFFAMGAVLALRLYHNPFLLTGLIPVLWEQLKPVVLKYIVPYFTKRMSPELEAEMQKCLRRGGEWDNFRKKCRERR